MAEEDEEGKTAEDAEEAGVESYRRHLVARHEEIPIREFEPELATEDAFGWKLRQPSALRLRNFLDAHVPDGENDCFYADRVLETLVVMLLEGYGAQELVGYLEDAGALPEDIDEANRVITLLNGLVNSLPNWENNGWSPYELLEKETGHKVFFNDDGSVMKVGRNDPCPCGSGKKYKRCCGE